MEQNDLELLNQLLDEEGIASASTGIPRRSDPARAPLSYQQQRLWFVDQFDPESSAFNMSGALRLSGKLDRQCLESALMEMVRRHEALRTTFQSIDGLPIQKIVSEMNWKLESTKLSQLTKEQGQREVLRLVSEEIQRPFDLTRGPLFRAKLIEESADEHILILTLHHIIGDGWSIGIFIQEFSDLYAAAVRGEKASLKELPIQYADYATWQREQLDQETLGEQLSYWKQQLAGAAALQMPTDRQRPRTTSRIKGAVHKFILPGEVQDALKQLGQKEGATLAIVMLAGFQALLARYSRQTDIVVGSPIANRSHTELEGLIGFFVNMLVMRADASGDPSFRHFLQRVKEMSLNAYAHQDVPFEMLVDELKPERQINRHPLFQISFIFQNFRADEMKLPDLTVRRIGENESARFDLELFVNEGPQGIGGSFIYDSQLFDSATIERMADHYVRLLKSASSFPEKKLSNLELMGVEEEKRVLVEWNDTQIAKKHFFVHERFSEKAHQTPQALAVELGQEQMTYAELEKRSNQLANYFKKAGVSSEVLVGICMERSLELVVTILGILKAGGAYLPLDPAYPSERLFFMIEDSGTKLLVTQSALKGVLKVENFQGEILELDQIEKVLDGESVEMSKVELTPENLAYVIYTSGSTGKPKGSMIHHRGLTNYLDWAAETYRVKDGEGTPLHSSISFDLTITSLFPSLITGKPVFLVPESKGVEELAEVIRRKKSLSLVKLTPAHLEILGQVLKADEVAGSARAFIVGGEALRSDHIDFWCRNAPQTRIVNEYGPTETVVGCCIANFDEVGLVNGSVPIGEPIANMQMYVLDENLNPVPIGVTGELYIGGLGVGRGYLKRPDLTAERFIPHPWGNESNSRLYKTGDLGRYLPDGNIDFLGRVDTQVKIRGYRIETGEIESVLASHPFVKEAVVTVRDEAHGQKSLAAYVVPNLGQDHLQEKRREWIDEHISQWQMSYEETYRQPNPENDSTFNIVGWNSSYTGKLLPADEMRQWREATVRQILDLKPRRVLEVGSGSGLLLFEVAPKSEEYWGTDFSKTTIENVERIVREKNLSQVKLLHKRADEIQDLPAGRFDVVVINSVIQYFSSADYLYKVLEGALAALGESGSLFVGDVRDLALLKAYHASVQFYQADDSVTREELRQKFLRALLREEELVVDTGFFEEFARQHSRITSIEIRPRKEGYVNELSKFRYDVVLHVGKKKEVREEYQLAPNVEKALAFDLDVLAWLEADGGPATVGEFRLRKPHLTSPLQGRKNSPLLSLTNNPLHGKIARNLILQLKTYLESKVPDYMVPSGFLLLEELPLTINGKVDRKALPPPEGTGQFSAADYIAPRSPEEQIIAGIMEQILEVERVGIRDDFFKLGGHSLLATQVISRVRQAFKLEVPLRILFEKPTPAGLAEWISTTRRNDHNFALPDFTEKTLLEKIPLSFSQQRLWFLEQLNPGQTNYHISMTLHLKGALDVEALKKSFSELVRRHDTLRTRFVMEDGTACQVIDPFEIFTLSVTDESSVAEAGRSDHVVKLAQKASQVPFDFVHGPLFRVSLHQFSKTDHFLLIVIHHIISDGWSMGVMVQELSALYEAFRVGKKHSLPRLEFQYTDYSVWQQSWLRGERLDRELEYWKSHLKDPPVLTLPTDHVRPPIFAGRGGHVAFELEPALTRKLKELSQKKGATLFMTLMTAYYSLLNRYSGQKDLVIGTSVANRQRYEVESLIGFFVNMLALRADLSTDPSFSELLEQVKETSLNAYSHQDVPFEAVVDALGVKRDMSRTPLFQVVFTLLNLPGKESRLPGLSIREMPVEDKTSKFDLSLLLAEDGNRLAGVWEFSSDIFEEETIRRMSGHFLKILNEIVANPESKLSQINLLKTEEVQQANTDLNLDDGSAVVHALFEAHAAKNPNAIALSQGEKKLSYRELNEKSNILAHYLREKGVGPEVPVGLFFERSFETIIGLLAVLKAGGYFLPLSEEEPLERLEVQLKGVQPKVVLTQDRLRSKLPNFLEHVFAVDTEWKTLDAERIENPKSGVGPDNLIYVMYTSGSTGKPKGISIPHRGVSRLVRKPNFGRFSSNDVSIHVAPLSFDGSTLEIWSVLANGGRLEIVPAGIPSLRELGEILVKSGATSVPLTTGLFNQMVDHQLEDFKGIRQLFAAGDVLSIGHAKTVLAKLPQCQLINGYGPTEGTVFTCCHSLNRTQKFESSVPIGKAVTGTSIYILDEHLNPVPAGVVGDLYTGGFGLARGYFSRPELTAENFVPNPFASVPGERLYRTGDQARFLEGGVVEFLGRVDQQVKLRGFRIELGEIESAIRQFPKVEDVTVAIKVDQRGEKRLMAYLVMKDAKAFSLQEIRNFLEGKLPDYMVPGGFVPMKEFPLNRNGKVDRKALPLPDTQDLENKTIAPRNALEFQLCTIWEEILQTKPVGVRDNFFELGGHSLLATRVVAEIEKRIGERISLTTLFQKATIEELAMAIYSGKATPPYSPLVKLKVNGTKKPFFCVHQGGGSVLAYHDLAREFDPDRPFYGLQSKGMDGLDEPLKTIEEMASTYIKAMREVQPEGPYILSGHSLGGSVAYEMAVQLEAEKAGQVGALIILDHSAPGPERLKLDSQPSSAQVLDFMAHQIGDHFGVKFEVSLKELEKLDEVRQIELFLQGARSAGIASPEVDQRVVCGLVEVYKTNLQALAKYQPKKYVGKLTLLCTEEMAKVWAKDESCGWRDLVGDVRVERVEGDHMSMLRKPLVTKLVENLKKVTD